VADRACPRILIPKPPAEQRHAALANQDSREEGGVGTKTPTTSCPLHTDTQAHKTETNTTRQASLLLPWWQGGGRGKRHRLAVQGYYYQIVRRQKGSVAALSQSSPPPHCPLAHPTKACPQAHSLVRSAHIR
jgi:hypothetical protein